MPSRTGCCSRFATLWKVSTTGEVIWRRDFGREATEEDRAAGLVTIGYSCDFDSVGNIYHAGYGNVPIETNGALTQRPLYTVRSYNENGGLRWSWSDAPTGNVDGFGFRSGPTPVYTVRCLPDDTVLVGDASGFATLLSSAGVVIWTAEISGPVSAINPVAPVTGFTLLETVQDVSLWHWTSGGVSGIGLFSNADGSAVEWPVPNLGTAVTGTLRATLTPAGVVVAAVGSSLNATTVCRVDPPNYETLIYMGSAGGTETPIAVRTDGDMVVVTRAANSGSPSTKYFAADFAASYTIGELDAAYPASKGALFEGSLNEDVLFVGDTIGMDLSSASASYGGRRRTRSFGAQTITANAGATVNAVTDARIQDGVSIWSGTRSEMTFIPES